ncbi:hypothetical protein B0H12DRAFT_700523 [Mycena haematopus]|nr:hypothetical protein B0H12DRAFT_700523 [Mycena haematopus]
MVHLVNLFYFACMCRKGRQPLYMCMSKCTGRQLGFVRWAQRPASRDKPACQESRRGILSQSPQIHGPQRNFQHRRALSTRAPQALNRTRCRRHYSRQKTSRARSSASRNLVLAASRSRRSAHKAGTRALLRTGACTCITRGLAEEIARALGERVDGLALTPTRCQGAVPCMLEGTTVDALRVGRETISSAPEQASLRSKPALEYGLVSNGRVGMTGNRRARRVPTS